MVSIIMPTYNRASTIIKAIESVLNQTYQDLELIVVDDGSDDNTEELIQKISDSRLKFIKHLVNLGACAARNTGIQIARGEYIAFQDSDTIWHEDKLIRQLNTIKSVNADVVCCSWLLSNGPESRMALSYEEGFMNRNVFGIGTPTIFGKSEVFKEIQFNDQMPRLQDFELLFRIREKYTIFYKKEALIDVCYDNNGISKSPVKLLQACELLLEIHPNLTEVYPQMAYELANLLLSESRLLNQNNKEIGRNMRKLALKYSLRLKVLIKYFLLSRKLTWKLNHKGHIILKKLK